MAIYLDHAATVPIGKEVLAAYIEAMSVVGNPASVHSQGQNAKRMLEEAREQVAASLGASPIEVTFTSGGTESINLAIKGLYWARNQKSRERSENTLKTDVLGSHAPSHGVFPRVLIAGGEHHATIDAAEWLEKFEGAVVEQIPIDELGRVDLDALDRMLGDDVALVSILLANNEVGTIQPVEKVVEIAARYGVPVHVDAVAAYGYVPIDFHAIGAAVLSVSAHKIAGPVGVGALLISRSAKVIPLLHGGNQQRSRSGTQDAAGAVAFGVAARLATENIPAHSEHLRALRDRLIAGIEAEVPSAVLRGDPVNRLPGNAHFTFPGCEGDSLLFVLDGAGFSVSTGSACQAGVAEPSHVLQAMGLNAEEARGAMRLTLGNDTTEAEIDAFLAALPDAVSKATAAGFADRPVGARA